MNNKEFLEFAEKEFSLLLETLRQKNSDYTADSPDAFANFKVTQALGLSSAETGILIRTVDKIQRVKSFLAKGSLEVPNESAQDAVRDIIGYSVILLGMLQERAGNKHTGDFSVFDKYYKPREAPGPETSGIQYTVTQPFMTGKKTSGAV